MLARIEDSPHSTHDLSVMTYSRKNLRAADVLRLTRSHRMILYSLAQGVDL